MKSPNKPLDWLIIAVLIAPFLYAALVWDQLPARMAIHFDMEGRVNGTQQKATFLLMMAGIQVLLYALLRFVPGAGVLANNQTSNYHRLRLVVTLFLSGIIAWTIYTAMQPGTTQNTTPVLLMAMALLAAIGNYITTVRPNFFVGIRTPWTLFNETVWRKTHQLAGRVWVGGSILGAILLVLVPMAWQIPVLLTVVGVLIAIPAVYSYIVFREEKRRVA
jgi:uncharacterized membrane protein